MREREQLPLLLKILPNMPCGDLPIEHYYPIYIELEQLLDSVMGLVVHLVILWHGNFSAIVS
jgi:hypothetical protein